jgi:cytochrome c
MKKIGLLVLVGLLFTSFAYAADRGTAKEAQALVKKAITFYKANGKAKALDEFSNPKGQFILKDLYIYSLDLNGKAIAHGINQKLVGKDMIDIRDSAGKFFVKDIISIAKSKGSGWVDYKWTDPVTKKIEPKSTYLEKVDDVIILCGFYK